MGYSTHLLCAILYTPCPAPLSVPIGTERGAGFYLLKHIEACYKKPSIRDNCHVWMVFIKKIINAINKELQKNFQKHYVTNENYFLPSVLGASFSLSPPSAAGATPSPSVGVATTTGSSSTRCSVTVATVVSSSANKRTLSETTKSFT